MGLIDTIKARLPKLGGVGVVVTGLAGRMAQVRDAAADLDAHGQSLSNLAERHVDRPTRGFRSFLDSLNNLPGPVAVVATTAMVGFAVIDPTGFSARMNGLNQVPEPVWWLAGGLVSFYFGAREMRFARGRAVVEALAASVLPPSLPDGAPAPMPMPEGAPVTDAFADNAALRDWAALRN